MEFLRQYEVLFKKGCIDFRAATVLLKSINSGDEELDLETIMFHLQQSAEKLLKGLLAYNKYHFTKTHSLKTLIDAITESNINIFTGIEALIPLSTYAVEGRYAVIHDDLDDAEKYIVLVDKLISFVKKEINL